MIGSQVAHAHKQWHELWCIQLNLIGSDAAITFNYYYVVYMICFPIFNSRICRIRADRIGFHCDVILRNLSHTCKLCNVLMNFSLSFQVRDLVEKCTCPSQFPMIRVSEGKYRIGDTKVLIFVRVSTSRFMSHTRKQLAACSQKLPSRALCALKDHRIELIGKTYYECNIGLCALG